MVDDVRVTRWAGGSRPAEADLLELMAAEGLRPYSWSNAPGDVYPAHTHGYHKVLYVLQGTITFGLLDLGEHVTLYPGDRLDLPPGVLHNAVVGPQGVACLEAYRD